MKNESQVSSEPDEGESNAQAKPKGAGASVPAQASKGFEFPIFPLEIKVFKAKFAVEDVGFKSRIHKEMRLVGNVIDRGDGGN